MITLGTYAFCSAWRSANRLEAAAGERLATPLEEWVAARFPPPAGGPSMRRSGVLLVTALGFGVLLSACGSGASPVEKPGYAVVPNLVGLKAGNAVGELSLIGFSFAWSTAPGWRAKVVIAQSPHAGVSVPITATVDLTLGANRPK